MYVTCAVQAHVNSVSTDFTTGTRHPRHQDLGTRSQIVRHLTYQSSANIKADSKTGTTVKAGVLRTNHRNTEESFRKQILKVVNSRRGAVTVAK